MDTHPVFHSSTLMRSMGQVKYRTASCPPVHSSDLSPYGTHAGGFISVLLGTAFLMSAFSYWRAVRYLMRRARPQLHDEGRLADSSTEGGNT
jgi:hypothetical protein